MKIQFNLSISVVIVIVVIASMSNSHCVYHRYHTTYMRPYEEAMYYHDQTTKPPPVGPANSTSPILGTIIKVDKFPCMKGYTPNGKGGCEPIFNN
jgi:hypothetical protein